MPRIIALPGTLLDERSLSHALAALNPRIEVLGTCPRLDDELDRLAAMAPEPTWWVGHLLGGIVALQLAARHPGTVAWLVMLAANARAASSHVQARAAAHRAVAEREGLLYGGADYARHANSEILALAMVETRAGLDALEGIVRTPNLDGVFAGPTDLGIALGLGPEASHEEPVLAEALAHIAAVCKAHGRLAGIWCNSAEMGRLMVTRGYRFVVPGHDALWLKAELGRRLGVLHA
jgi:pimeloyl-ACP methyl ester carboxylesterase